MSEVPLRLHIGGEEPKAGWTILNVQEGPYVDALGDCRDLSGYSDGSVAEIYASHVFEHLGYLDELPQADLKFLGYDNQEPPSTAEKQKMAQQHLAAIEAMLKHK